jgi:hypothetical protein
MTKAKIDDDQTTLKPTKEEEAQAAIRQRQEELVRLNNECNASKETLFIAENETQKIEFELFKVYLNTIRSSFPDDKVIAAFIQFIETRNEQFEKQSSYLNKLTRLRDIHVNYLNEAIQNLSLENQQLKSAAQPSTSEKK